MDKAEEIFEKLPVCEPVHRIIPFVPSNEATPPPGTDLKYVGRYIIDQKATEEQNWRIMRAILYAYHSGLKDGNASSTDAPDGATSDLRPATSDRL